MDMGEKDKPKIIIKVDARSTSEIKIVSSSHPVEIVKRRPK